MLANQNSYLKTAYETLEEISADQQKRLEYDARQKALYHYNTMMIESHERGWAEGNAEGRAEGITKSIIMMRNVGASTDMIVDNIMEQYGMTKAEAISTVNKTLSQI